MAARVHTVIFSSSWQPRAHVCPRGNLVHTYVHVSWQPRAHRDPIFTSRGNLVHTVIILRLAVQSIAGRPPIAILSYALGY